MKLMFILFFMLLLFIFLLFIVFIIRKKLIKKIMFLEIDEDLKNLAPKEFFLNILKREKFSKIVNYVGFFLFLLFTFFIVFLGYQEYKVYSDFSITPIIPIFVWSVVSANLLLALLIKKRENKRISEMLDNLEKSKLLKCAKADFILSNKILETGILGNNIKFGSKFLFVIYPGYIIPYYCLDDINVKEIFGRYGSKSYYVNVILKVPFKPINITFAKKEVCEKIRYILLKRKYKAQNDKPNI
ncbi:hypothetical protein [Leptotrichia sp. oral taxon 212]|uniref:hypothetical protein n=1 Tax=Leptotrichia sp. oral taxon 212 TaxID=712357 RepID=UPI0006A9E0C6|nr:hypothetical protein [Leptotrichia sp. oral taxon 212]ALA96510.1 hypothetical protein AMK43_11320 [Leptotrichia sp. oral taxon 212]